MKIVVDKDLKLRPYNNNDRAALYKNSRDRIFLKYMEYKKFSVSQFNGWLKRKKKSNIKGLLPVYVYLILKF